MSIATTFIMFFEISMLILQVVRFRERPEDKKRLRYLILLTCLLLFNVCKIVFPNNQFSISPTVQLAITNTAGFCLIVYSGYFLYRAFDLNHIKFFMPNGAILSMPLVSLFALPEFDKPLRLSITPFIFSFCVIYCGFPLLVRRLKQPALREMNTESMKVIVSVYIALVWWAVVPVLSSLGNFHAWDFLLMNSGFIGMTLIYVHSAIKETNAAYAELELSRHLKTVVSENQAIFLKYRFTKTEIEIVNLVASSGYTSKKIADSLHRSEHTINKHIQNIFKKAGVNSRAQLIEKLNLKPHTI